MFSSWICFPVVLILQMKDSLLNLQRGIGLRDYTSETEEKRSRYHWHATIRPWGHAVQYRTCFLCEPVCRQQGDRERTERVVGPTVSGSTGERRGTVISNVQKFKPPLEEEIMDRKCPDLTHRNWGIPSITEALQEGARLASSKHRWDNRFLLLSLFPSAPYCKPCEPGAWQRERRKTSACI